MAGGEKPRRKGGVGDGKRWPNDVEFMDFTDGLEMFPYFFFKESDGDVFMVIIMSYPLLVVIYIYRIPIMAL